MSNASATIDHSDKLSEDEKQLVRPPLVLNQREMGWISSYISSIVEGKTPMWWYVSMAITVPMTLMCLALLGYLISTGVGVWGNNHPIGWAWDITNFVFWIGIGHAGTLISAILFLTRQKWRTSINRAAEAMTLFAVVCAGIYPALHVGRVWMAWFLAPFPTRTASGKTFVHRFSGTFSLYPLTSPYPCCFGILV